MYLYFTRASLLDYLNNLMQIILALSDKKLRSSVRLTWWFTRPAANIIIVRLCISISTNIFIELTKCSWDKFCVGSGAGRSVWRLRTNGWMTSFSFPHSLPIYIEFCFVFIFTNLVYPSPSNCVSESHFFFQRVHISCDKFWRRFSPKNSPLSLVTTILGILVAVVH